MKYLMILTILLLFITAFMDLHVQYIFYQILRWIVTASAIFAAIQNKDKNIFLFISFCIIAIIFNPVAPFYMAKQTWRFIDGITGVIFAIHTLKNK